MYEVFGDDLPTNLPIIPISELVNKNQLRNKGSVGMWLSIYGKVYDVTSFCHPGGSRILESYCGMDCTVAWEAVRHHKSQSLNAKLATLIIGELHLPKFSPLPLFPLGDKGTVTDYNGVFDAAKQMMFTIVEIENALQMEYSLDNLHIAGKEMNSSTLTPMKFQMLFQVSKRTVLLQDHSKINLHNAYLLTFNAGTIIGTP